MTTHGSCTPNHHAHYPHFSGVTGYIAAASMIGGRSFQATLAAHLSGLKADDVVVDIGCGPGAGARYAARVGATVTGIDPAPVMLRVARLLTRSSRVRYLDGSAEHIPLPDDSASIVWTIASVHHWSDVDAGLREVRRVLRPNGRFIAIERHSVPDARGLANHGWTDAQAAAFGALCADHGFAAATIATHHEGRRPSISITTVAS